MRASIMSAVIAATLGITAILPTEAKAQIMFYPSINTSPYYNYNWGSWYPSYNYAYSVPNYYGGNTSYWGWNNGYTYGNYAWATGNPYYSGYYSSPNYYGYRGWNGRWHRW